MEVTEFMRGGNNDNGRAFIVIALACRRQKPLRLRVQRQVSGVSAVAPSLENRRCFVGRPVAWSRGGWAAVLTGRSLLAFA